jgi:hypothetical protein
MHWQLRISTTSATNIYKPKLFSYLQRGGSKTARMQTEKCPAITFACSLHVVSVAEA